MNDEDLSGAEDRAEDFDQEADRPKGSSSVIGLSGFMKSAGRTAAVLNSIDRKWDPLLRQIRRLESTRRSMGLTTEAYQAALDAQRRYQEIAGPVLALPSDLSAIYDWHGRINDVVRSVSLPRTLLDQLAAAAAFFLPANLSGLDNGDLSAVLDVAADDGLSLAWAPRTEIVRALLPLSTRAERHVLLCERRDDVLDDIDASLQIITHPELTDMVTLLSAASRTARAGFGEGAQALAGNVLDTTMKRHGNAWIRRSFPQAAYPKGGHHGTISSALDGTDDWGDLTLLQFKPYLVLAGMRNVFGPGVTQDTFNRHLGAHEASPDTYRPEFVLPAILLAHSLLRVLNQDLEHPDDEESDA